MPKKADILLHPLRMRIIQELVEGTPLTTTELVKRLKTVPQATVYRHVRQLLDAEFIQVVDTNRVQGTQERVFAVIKENLALPQSEMENSTSTEHLAYFTTFTAQLLQLAEAYMSSRSPKHFAEDGFGYWQTPMHMTDEEFHAFTVKLQALLREAAALPPSHGRRTRMLNTIMIPKPVEGGADQT
ncbi:helix-turn-helix domain-containing protein [Paenibacillus sp. 1P07SE]|uniref:helix-turn-helix domain-containing protein n=1 Tax=Paenibacillus sp. 1P07SE TaxID=3132209 RepID=UPI0039A5A829